MASKDITGGEAHAEDAGYNGSASKNQTASPEQRERDEVNPSPPDLQSNSPGSVSKPPTKPANPSQSRLKSPQLTQAVNKPKGKGKLTDKSEENEAESKLKEQVREGTSPPPTADTIAEEKPSMGKGRSSDGSSAQVAATKPQAVRKQEPPNQATKEAPGIPAKEQRQGESSTPTSATEVQTTISDTTDSTADCEHDEFECRKCRKVVRRDSMPLHTHPKSEVKKPAAPIAKAPPTRKVTEEGSKKPTVVRASEQSAPSSPALPPTPIQNPTPQAAVRSSEKSAASSHALPSTPIQDPIPQAAQKPKQQSSTPQSISKPVTQKQATPSSNATTSPKSSAPRLAPTGKAPPKSSGVSSTKSTEVASKHPEDTSSKSSSDARDEEQNTSSQLGQVCEDETCDECHQIVRKRCGKCDQVLPQARQ